MYLIDTNIISELRRVRPHVGLITWLDRIPADQLHVSAVSAGEIQRGIELTRSRDATKAYELERWLEASFDSFHFLPMSVAIFRRWAVLMVGSPMALAQDGMIAATASVHRLTVVSRNVRDFSRFGITVINPFEIGSGESSQGLPIP